MSSATRVRPTGAAGPQLLPLIGLRWRMVRSARTRRLLMLAATVPLLLCALAVAIGRLLPSTPGDTDLLIIVPSLLLGFVLLSIITPLAAGGGNELYPQDQLVGFPVRSRTIALAALVLAPLNLAWLLQVLLSLGLVSYASRTNTLATIAAAVTILTFVVMATTFGQTVGWLVVGIRQTDAGRVATWGALAALSGAFLLLLRTGRLTDLLDSSPTVWVLATALRPSAGAYGEWAWRTLLILLVALAFAALSTATCSWALRQPDLRRGLVRRASTSTTGRSFAATMRGDGAPTTLSEDALRLRIDRAGVWRSPPLRRGVLILALLPAAALLVAGSEESLVLLLPGLVAAGSALLFAVNAFCLDGAGATWLASLPGDPSRWYWGRVRLVAEVATVTVVPLTVVGLARLPNPPTATLVLAVLIAAITSITWVTAVSLRASVTRPHRALLLGPRDTPAPPGAMAVHSIRLSVATTGIGIAFTIAALTSTWWSPVLLGVMLLAFALRSLLRTSALWNDPVVRSRLVTVVGSG